jgi:hypothetical protein
LQSKHRNCVREGSDNAIFLALVYIFLLVAAVSVPVTLAAQTVRPRPVLEVGQGSHFRWSAPIGWLVNETSNGVDMAAPDRVTGVSSVIALGFPGGITGSEMVLSMVRMVPGVTDLRVVSNRALPDQPSGPMRTPWSVTEMELAYTYNGVPVRATWTCGVSSIPGYSYDAFMLGYQAPAARFDEDRLWLWRLANSIIIVNTAGIAGTDRLIPPRNRPLDNSALIESWRLKGLSEDRIAKARREGMMGYERMKDAETGKIYEMPLEAYDGTVGGYRNPRRPYELLKRTEPGE